MAITKQTEKIQIEPTKTPGKSKEYCKLEGLFRYYKKKNLFKWQTKQREFETKLEAIDLGVKWHPKMKELGVKGYIQSFQGRGSGAMDKAEIEKIESLKKKAEPKAKLEPSAKKPKTRKG